MDKEKLTRYFFVDEAGDLTLFNKKKRTVPLGVNGVSRYFILGFAEVLKPEKLDSDMRALRADLISDPTLKNIPSISKTAEFFHAKDDFQAVRREVFALLQQTEIKFWALIRDKVNLQNRGRFIFEQYGKKLTDKEVYEDSVSRLSKYLLHKSDENHFVFAERGKTITNHSMASAIQKAESRIFRSWGIEPHGNNHIQCGHPKMHPGLQAVDYLLWALQRLYERKEDYYFNKISSKYRLIMDIDDTRNKPYGEWYSQSNKLGLNCLKE